MALQTWNLLSDNFDHEQLENNFVAIDQHDHTFGKGVQIPTGGIKDGAITDAKIAANTITGDRVNTDTTLQIANLLTAAIGGGWLKSRDTGVTETSSIFRNVRLIASGGFAYLQVLNDDGSHIYNILKIPLNTSSAIEFPGNVLIDGGLTVGGGLTVEGSLSAAGGPIPHMTGLFQPNEFEAFFTAVNFGSSNTYNHTTIGTSFGTVCTGALATPSMPVYSGQPAFYCSTVCDGASNAFELYTWSNPPASGIVEVQVLAWGG